MCIISALEYASIQKCYRIFLSLSFVLGKVKEIAHATEVCVCVLGGLGELAAESEQTGGSHMAGAHP